MDAQTLTETRGHLVPWGIRNVRHEVWMSECPGAHTVNAVGLFGEAMRHFDPRSVAAEPPPSERWFSGGRCAARARRPRGRHGRPWYWCATAWPLPRAIIARFTGTVTTNATTSERASEPQNSRSTSPASIAPGTTSEDEVVHDLHDEDRDGVGGERDGHGGTQVHTGAEHRRAGQQVAEEERQHDGQRDARAVRPAPPGGQHHAEHLADGTSGQAVQGRGDGGSPRGVHAPHYTPRGYLVKWPRSPVQLVA